MTVRLASVILMSGAALAASVFGASGAEAPAKQHAGGAALFLTGCSGCHGAQGEGTPAAPSVIGAGEALTDFMLTTGRMPMTDSNGLLKRKPPAYGPEEIRLLREYVASLGPGTPMPEVHPKEGDLALGERLYSGNCAACHSVAATGGALGRGIEAPPLDQATPLQIAQAVRTGPGTMPVFGPDTLDERALDSVVAYILDLRGSGNPGGWGISRVGPIAEGFVAWVFGAGAFLMVSRWIGEKE